MEFACAVAGIVTIVLTLFALALRFVVRRIESIEKHANEVVNNRIIGNLRIDHSDGDNLFLELESSCKLHDGEIVSLRVVDKNYIPDKTSR